VDTLRLGRAPYWGAFGLESSGDEHVIRAVADSLDLTDLLPRRMDELSGGQRQRVFVGRCLAQEPKAMLLDEPNTYLDLRHQIDLCRLLRRLADERGIAVLMASHDLNLAAAFSDRVVVLEEGRVALHGKADSVMDAGVLSRVYGVELRRVESIADNRAVMLPKFS
jgi:iron complex transport system ATP-binding protein